VKYFNQVQPLEELEVISIGCPNPPDLQRLVESIVAADLPIWSLRFINPRMAERIPMPDYMREQMPILMPQVMNSLMPHMIGEVVPLVTRPMIDYLRGKNPALLALPPGPK
jgi:hypothetical protein